jgi:monofunctional biosynthetic peptidoglycan transglycosylase
MVTVARVRKSLARARRRTRWRRWAKILLVVAASAAVLYHSIILARVVWYKRARPASTALMEQRADEARAEDRTPRREQTWLPYNKISPNLIRAVLAGEDSRFFDHAGFDWEEIAKALEKDWEEKRFHRGASTITQQLAKNLFLSTSKNPLRKLHEALITSEMELILGKRRILELYLNVIEWGDGVYGAEAAAHFYFNASAGSLTTEQAAFLSAIIPNPRTAYNPSRHPRRVSRRQNLILRLMRHVVIPRDLS